MAGVQVAPPEPQGGGVVLLKLGEGEGVCEVLKRLDADTSVRAVVIAGQSESSWAAEASSEVSRLGEIRFLRLPVIAALDGQCRGAGLSLALSCDIRFAAEGAELDAAVARKGLASGDTSAYVLPQLVGSGNAILSLIAGDECPAEKMPPGLLQRTVPKKDVLKETLAFAKKVAAAGPQAVAATKQQVYGLLRRNLTEAQAIDKCLEKAGGAEQEEGKAALTADRAPKFSDFDGAQPLAATTKEVFAPDWAGGEEQPQGEPDKWENSDLLSVDFHEAGVVQVTLNSKKTQNAWGPELDADFFKVMNWLDSEAGARVIVITGYQREFARDGERMAAEANGRIRRFTSLRQMVKPIIACVNGTCHGRGLSLALACDIRFVAKGAEFRAGFAQSGRPAEDDAGYTLPQLVGASEALCMLLGGEAVKADKLPPGLAQKLYDREDVLKESLEFGKKLSVFSSPSAMGVIKFQTYDHPLRNFDEAHHIAQALCGSTLSEWNPDHMEGMRIFGTGQPPNFQNFDMNLPFVMKALHFMSQPPQAPGPYEVYNDVAEPPKEGLEFSTVVVEEHEEGVVVISLNKRTRMNAWGPDIDQEFFEVLEYYDSEPSTRVIVITGQGFFFCAGHDAEFTKDGENLNLAARPKLGFLRGFGDMRKMRTPTIAAVNGAACGIGLSLALVCDIRFACPDAKFGVIFPTRALIGEEGTAYILPQLCGVGDSMVLLLTGENIPAQDLPNGIVQRMFPRKDLLPETVAFAKKLSRNSSPTAMAVVKQQALMSRRRPFEEAIEEASKLAASSLEEDNPDRLEAAAALAESREPSFRLFDASLPFLRLARGFFGGLFDRIWPLPKPYAKAAPEPAKKALPAPKAEPEPKSKPKPAAKTTGPQLAVLSFKVTASGGVTVRKRPAEDAPELSHIDSGDTVFLQEESFDGWAKLADEDGWVRRLIPGEDSTVTLQLEPEDGETLTLASPEPIAKPGARKFKVTLKSGVGIKAEPKPKAKVTSQKKVGELVIAEAQTYDGWLRLARNQGWVLAVGGSAGKMLEPAS
mmetsp:Transcript_38097/g.109936  ORF Transcript_38097/g.109936 Transcript_38097/m.109936 type:complete len:1039 (-) Transcript_38097:142-3258(-)